MNNKFVVNFKDNQFSPDDAAKGLFLFIVFQAIISYTFEALRSIGINYTTFWSYFFTVLLDISFIFVVFLVAKSQNKSFLPNLKFEKKPSWVIVLMALLISLISIFGFSGITNVFLEFLYSFGYHSSESSIVVSSFGRYILYTFLVCIMPAVCEEILFRGLIFTGLKKINIYVGIFGSALLFMLMHQNPDQTIHQFMLGVVLAISFYMTESLFVPMLIHFFNNFLAITYSYLFYGDSAEVVESTVNISMLQYLLFSLITLAISVALLYLIFKYMSRVNEKAQQKKTENPEFRVIDGNKIVFETAEFAKEEDAIYRNEKIADKIKPERSYSTMGKVMLGFSICYMIFYWLLNFIGGMSVV